MSTDTPKTVSGAYQATARDLWAEVAVMLAAAALMVCFGQHTLAMTALMPALIGARFFLLYRRGDGFVFVLGLVLGGGSDMMSMWKGVYFYTPPTHMPVPIPAWMVLFWGEAFLFFRRLMRAGPFIADDTVRPGLDWPLALDLALLIPLKTILYRTAAVPWLPDAAFASALLLRHLAAPPLPHERRLLLTILVFGPLYEIVLVRAGLYVYTHGVLLGLPLWLAIYWLYVFRAIKAILDRFELRLAARESKP